MKLFFDLCNYLYVYIDTAKEIALLKYYTIVLNSLNE